MRMIDQFLEIGMEVQAFDRRLKRRQEADGKPDSARSGEDVDAASHALNGPGKIGRPTLKKLRPLRLAQNLMGITRERGGCNGITRGVQRPTDANGCRQSGLEMQVAGALLSGRGN